jgi:hypothetical protein
MGRRQDYSIGYIRFAGRKRRLPKKIAKKAKSAVITNPDLGALQKNSQQSLKKLILLKTRSGTLSSKDAKQPQEKN